MLMLSGFAWDLLMLRFLSFLCLYVHNVKHYVCMRDVLLAVLICECMFVKKVINLFLHQIEYRNKSSVWILPLLFTVA